MCYYIEPCLGDSLRNIQVTLVIRMLLVKAFVCIYVVNAQNILSILASSVDEMLLLLQLPVHTY